MPELRSLRVGIALVFMQHTSASLTLNENASPDVRRDFAAWFDRAVPDGADYFTHTLEGDDDMPAHIKASLTGASLVLPVRDGRLALGTWQGIYLCEHRDNGGPRRLIVTAFGRRLSRPRAVCEHVFVRWDNLKVESGGEPHACRATASRRPCAPSTPPRPWTSASTRCGRSRS